MERGKFAAEHQASKRKPNSSKTLHFDTLKCASCAGYVLVLWSVSEHGGMQGIHDFRVLPWPLRLDDFPEHWPKTETFYIAPLGEGYRRMIDGPTAS